MQLISKMPQMLSAIGRSGNVQLAPQIQYLASTFRRGLTILWLTASRYGGVSNAKRVTASYTKANTS